MNPTSLMELPKPENLGKHTKHLRLYNPKPATEGLCPIYFWELFVTCGGGFCELVDDFGTCLGRFGVYVGRFSTLFLEDIWRQSRPVRNQSKGYEYQKHFCLGRIVSIPVKGPIGEEGNAFPPMVQSIYCRKNISKEHQILKS